METRKVLKDIEKNSKKMSWPIVGPKKGKLLEKLIKHYKPKNVLEVGSLVGYSAILMGQHLQKNGKITAIEINPEFGAIARKNFETAGLKKYVDLIIGDAMSVIPKLARPFDMVFLDAAKDEYYSYLLLTENKLARNAIIVADNVKMFESQLRDYLDYVRQSVNYNSENYEFGDDAMEVSFRVA